MKDKLAHLNDGKLHIVFPLLATTADELKEQAEAGKNENPDLFEWRADAFHGIDNPKTRAEAIRLARNLAGDIPLLFACRDFSDRGKQDFSLRVKREILESAILSGSIDVIDIELSQGREYIERLRELAHANDVLLLIAHHDREKTPHRAEIEAIIRAEYDWGADILKYSFQPGSQGDVVRLAETTLSTKRTWQNRPCFSIADGEGGMNHRIRGHAFGTNLVFAPVGKVTERNIFYMFSDCALGWLCPVVPRV
jgi:3-dehydroquinate dehydratase-1